jgi:pimeloyl-ACP methyl ester carboxylesterase
MAGSLHAVRDQPISIDRAFVRLDEGLLHLRSAAPPAALADLPDARASAATRPALWMMHASPASSLSLVPLLGALAQSRRTFAPDALGFGDSAPPGVAEPDVAYYADAFIRALDALELPVVDLYGFHTGAHIAIEMALAAPGRIRRLVLDGLLVLDDTQRAEFLAEYAPALEPDAYGTQVFRALNFIRDQAWFFPHFQRDAAHNLGGGALPPTVLHMLTVDLLKAAPTYRLAYHAVFRHDTKRRIAAVTQPILLGADAQDPTRHGLDVLAPLVRRCDRVTFGADPSAQPLRAKAATIAAFLDRDVAAS